MIWRKLIPQRWINIGKHLPLAILAAIYYRFPARRLIVIGITGTDGKTTTASLIYDILIKAKFKTALISTVSAKIGNDELPTGLHVTTPNSWELQRLLKVIADKKFTHVILEATSHGLDQYRLWGCNFYIGVVTNITHDHLDYHKTYDNYLLSKAKLFKTTKISILNQDDESINKLKKIVHGTIISYGMRKGDITLNNFSFKTPLIGEYNLSNCLAAIAAAKALHIEEKYIREAVANFTGVVGRMQEIKLGQKFRVFIDFAHTPNALKNALKTLNKLPHKKLIAVFGCAGLRDREKRPLMGKIASSLADKVVLTAEDPRTESLTSIFNQICSGIKDQQKIIRQPDRQKAINLAMINLVKVDDIVGVFGKGHEQSMCFGTEEFPWSDEKVVRQAILRRLNHETN